MIARTGGKLKHSTILTAIVAFFATTAAAQAEPFSATIGSLVISGMLNTGLGGLLVAGSAAAIGKLVLGRLPRRKR